MITQNTHNTKDTLTKITNHKKTTQTNDNTKTNRTEKQNIDKNTKSEVKGKDKWKDLNVCMPAVITHNTTKLVAGYSSQRYILKLPKPQHYCSHQKRTKKTHQNATNMT